jgi:hypothetical protein
MDVRFVEVGAVASEDREARPDSAPSSADPGPSPPKPPPDRSRGSVWGIALGCGLVAGLAAWLAGELAYGSFQPRLSEVVIMQMRTVQSTTQTEHAAEFKNAMLAFALLGAITGLGMGAAGGLAGRSSPQGLIAASGGLAVGGLVGAGASLLALPLFYRQLIPDPNDILTPILVQAAIYLPIGALGGAAFALGRGNFRRLPHAVLGGILGALMATVLFHVIGASFFPDSFHTDPLATSFQLRLIARLLVTVLVAAGTARAVLGPRPRPAPARAVQPA